jgi:3-oxoacyl-[acyl-carrier-protein] synthase II
VVTGLGCVSPLGANVAATWQHLVAGQCAVGPLTVLPAAGYRVQQAAQVAKFPDLQRWDDRKTRRLSRASRLALPAVEETLRSAGLLGDDGLCTQPWLESALSTTACGMEFGEAFLRHAWTTGGPRGQLARIARYQAHQQVEDVQAYFGFRGPATIIANACASGANAIGHAADLIRAGMADMVLTGGYEALCDLVYTGFDCLQVLAPDRCRPFDRTRQGLVLGEAAAFLILESETHAAARRAPIRAVLAGYGHCTDPYHLTQPNPSGAALATAMRMALDDAALPPATIGYLNAHGTATPMNDSAEIAAYQTVFGAELPGLRVSSSKSAIGHTLGAAGSIEAVIALCALETGALPPQIHGVDPEPAIAHALVGPAEHAALNAVMSVNLGFGGSNAALIFSRP